MDTPYNNPVKIVEIDQGNDGQRIDNYLFTLLKGVPKSRVYRLMRKGQIRVNKGRIKPTYRLKVGDNVRIPPINMAEKGENIPPGRNVCDSIAASIIHEDDELLVINKPAGISVHAGNRTIHGVIEILRHLRPDLPHLELVHRLDRHTSGCLILAKSRVALLALQDLFRENGVEKHYYALLKGAWTGESSHLVDAPLLKREGHLEGRQVIVDSDGKSAQSIFQLKDDFEDACLVDVKLLTGRTHQIRVHADHIGHPLAGDEKYGDWAFNKQMKQRGLRRMFLHAHCIAFDLPTSQRHIQIEAPMPEEFTTLLERLSEFKNDTV